MKLRTLCALAVLPCLALACRDNQARERAAKERAAQSEPATSTPAGRQPYEDTGLTPPKETVQPTPPPAPVVPPPVQPTPPAEETAQTPPQPPPEEKPVENGDELIATRAKTLVEDVTKQLGGVADVDAARDTVNKAEPMVDQLIQVKPTIVSQGVDLSALAQAADDAEARLAANQDALSALQPLLDKIDTLTGP